MICYTVRATSIKQSINYPDTCKPVLNNKFQGEIGKWKLFGKCRKRLASQHIRSNICSYNVCIIALCFTLTANTTCSHTHTPEHTHTLDAKETKLIIRSGKTFPQTALCRNFGVSWEQNVDADCEGREFVSPRFALYLH